MKEQLTASIFDIQRFSLHDGPGIRTLIFFKGCPLSCDWCQNPESQNIHPVIAFYQVRCQQSYCCDTACQENAISREGFRIDYDRCTACGDCVEACAFDALRLIGEKISPTQLLDRVLADRTYFGGDGGITLTGGEPTLYPKFVNAFIDLCREHKIHTNIETSGRFDLYKWQPILEKMDLIYFDLKIFDPAHYKAAIGDGLEQILENAALLVKQNFPVEFRLALVPGYTDTVENVTATIQFLKSIGQKSIHLLEYHNMGEVKIDIIQGDQPKLGLNNCSSEKIHQVQKQFNEAGIAVVNQHA
ncbi:MAG: glycyl-radical enzyme activating protein [Proteobacteria bacterium]|nr:glycyl-radical enzyme activating protein [Pseudomonadota bacterium]